MPVLIALIGLIVGTVAVGAVSHATVEWEPVWLGGTDPWAIKIYRYRPTSWITPKARERGWQKWRVEILIHGEFVHEKVWRGTVARYMTEDHARSYADKWIAGYKGGA